MEKKENLYFIYCGKVYYSDCPKMLEQIKKEVVGK